MVATGMDVQSILELRHAVQMRERGWRSSTAWLSESDEQPGYSKNGAIMFCASESARSALIRRRQRRCLMFLSVVARWQRADRDGSLWGESLKRVRDRVGAS